MAKWQLFPMAALLLGAAGPSSLLGSTGIMPPDAATHGLGVEQRLAADVTITPVAIVEDSRCPVDALCVQAGQLVVTVRNNHRGKANIRALALGTTTLAEGGTILFAEAQERRVGDDAGREPDWFRFTYAPNIATRPQGMRERG